MTDLLAWIDANFADDDQPLHPGDHRTNRWQRHLMFARYGLGESFTGDLAAFHIAEANRTQPLPLHAMRHIAANWHVNEGTARHWGEWDPATEGER